MKGKLKFNLIGMEIIFLVIVIGGSALVYSLFAAPYYNYRKGELVKNAFEDIKEVDMTGLEDSDLDMLRSYEEEHLSFTISNDRFEPVYTTNKNSPNMLVKRNIEYQLDRFSNAPQVVIRNTRNSEGTRLRGTFSQDGMTYYVSIKETSGSTYGAFFYTERFLMLVVVLAIILGSIVMYYMSRRIAKPIEKMANVSRKLADHDFSARISEDTPYEEVNVLAKNFNDMADQIQYYVQDLEKKNTELEQRNEFLKDEKEQTEELERMRQEFFANISHELKTPLAVISSQMEMLELAGEGEQKNYYRASIREEIHKMADMIRNLMKVSAAEHELEELDMGKVDLSDCTHYLLLKYQALFGQKELKLVSEIEPGCQVWGDRACLEKAMSNYLLNAFNHTVSGNPIRIRLYPEGGQIFFRVYNQGEKIPSQEMKKIWKDYYQVKYKENHAGMGLYIVKKTILLHGGKYGAQNREKGVEFWFSMPQVSSCP